MQLGSHTDGRFRLQLPSTSYSSAKVADFIDGCPGFQVFDITHADGCDIIRFDTDNRLPIIVEEVCNAITDVFDADVTICRPLSPFSQNCNDVTCNG